MMLTSGFQETDDVPARSHLRGNVDLDRRSFHLVEIATTPPPLWKHLEVAREIAH